MIDSQRPLFLLVCGILLSQASALLNAQQKLDSELPWQQEQLSDRVIPFSIANSTTAKQMLEISGIGDSQLRFFIDNEPVTGKDIDTTGYVLRHFHGLDPSDIKRWSANHTLDTPTLLEAFLETPDDYRVDFYRVQGRVKKIKRQPVVEEAAQLLGFRSFFWIWLKPDHSEIPVRIATRKLPIAWFPEQWKTTTQQVEANQQQTENSVELAPDASFELDRPAAVDGLLLKIAEDPTGRREVIMAAPRLEWLPQKSSTTERINEGIALLSQFGFDAGLLDDLRRSNGKSMNSADTEAFFQILGILKDAESSQTIRQVSQDTSVPTPSISDYLQATRELQGELVNLHADVRQITRIDIRNEKMQHRLGLDHYWQLDAFVYLGEEAIQVKTNEADQAGLIYKHRYPVQICVLQLPEELKQAQTEIQLGTYRSNSLHEDVWMQGFFFKLWTYQSARTISTQEGRVQLSPLFIAHQIGMDRSASEQAFRSSIFLGIGFVTFLLTISGFLWRTNRADRGIRKQTENTRHDGGIDSDLISTLDNES